MLKKPWVWLLGALAVVAIYVVGVAPYIAQHSANKTFETNLAVLSVKAKELSSKLNEPAVKATIADATAKISRFSDLEKEYVSAYPDETKTGPKLDEIVTALKEMRALQATLAADEDYVLKLQEYRVALMTVVMRNPQLFAKRRQEVAPVIKEVAELYKPLAMLDRLKSVVDNSVTRYLLSTGKGTGPDLTADERAAVEKLVVKTLLDAAADEAKKAPQE